MSIRVHSCPFVVKNNSSQSGNILFFILIGIVLIGMVTFALRDTGGLNAGVDNESATVQAIQIIKYGGEVQRGVQTLLQNGASENDLRFAYPSANANYGTIATTPQYQVFSSQGANVPYRSAPNGSQTTPSSYNYTGMRALPQVGSANAELTMALIDVTDPVCTAINSQLGLSSKPTVAVCGTGNPISSSYPFDFSRTTLTPSSFAVLPALQFCAYCTDQAKNIYMYTLIAR